MATRTKEDGNLSGSFSLSLICLDSASEQRLLGYPSDAREQQNKM